jgi:hypothetical protein
VKSDFLKSPLNSMPVFHSVFQNRNVVVVVVVVVVVYIYIYIDILIL